MTFHFEMMASGVSGMFTGKPCPPVRCQRSCAIHPAATWNRPPVVSSFASLDKKPTSGAMYSSYKRMTSVRSVPNRMTLWNPTLMASVLLPGLSNVDRTTRSSNEV